MLQNRPFVDSLCLSPSLALYEALGICVLRFMYSNHWNCERENGSCIQEFWITIAHTFTLNASERNSRNRKKLKQTQSIH